MFDSLRVIGNNHMVCSPILKRACALPVYLGTTTKNESPVLWGDIITVLMPKIWICKYNQSIRQH